MLLLCNMGVYCVASYVLVVRSLDVLLGPLVTAIAIPYISA
jgi:hypothetical protein